MAGNRIQTKKIVVAALLVGLAIVIPYLSLPVVPIPEFSVTLFAHVAILIAMYMGVEVGIMAAIGSVIGFYLKGVPLVVVMRAASHLIFIVVGACMFKALQQKKANIYITGAVTGVLHALCEGVVVAFWFQSSSFATTFSVGVPIFFLHHTFDYFFATIIFSALAHAKLVKTKIYLPKWKKKTI